ncbi:MAG: tetratricopeptide repeat protein, partial [Planctomycetes bacterium]|nr:tetratricopeptide repeat protein [Planctomycetota bacterium]
MAQQLAVDVKGLLLEERALGREEAERLRATLNSDPEGVTRLLREATAQLEERLQKADEAQKQTLGARLGVAEHLLGRNLRATRNLRACAGDGVAAFYLGRALLAQRRFADADRALQHAAMNAYDAAQCTLLRVEALRGSRQLDEAERLLATVEAEAGESAEFLYQKGTCLAARGDDVAARPLFERALEQDDTHVGALFALAYANDLLGNDDYALELYERAAALRPLHVGALMNLGVLYEDRHQYDRAMGCYQRILDVYPTHPRARLFLKDARASRHMYYDEDAERKHDRLHQLLEIPVTDFELSVRSRNCLRRMNVFTLGDLTRTTEAELLASKNFGETSLQEIKDMMSSR